MHELSVTSSILHIVLNHAAMNGVKRVLSVNLEIGAMSDLQQPWMQKYFDRLSRGSVAQGASLRITRVPAVLECRDCRQSFEVASLQEEKTLHCQSCTSRNIRLKSGREYRVLNMEAY